MTYQENGHSLETDGAGYHREMGTNVAGYLGPSGEAFQPNNSPKRSFPTKINDPAPGFYKRPAEAEGKDNSE